MKHFLIIIISLFVIACSSSQNSSSKIVTPNSQAYLALGDSYTIGEKVAENSRWPNQLAEKLIDKGFSTSNTKIIAKTGWRTDQLIKATNSQDLEKNFNLVSLLIGVNNQFQKKSIQEFEGDLKVLIEFAISKSENGAKGVFVVSIPDYGITPFGKTLKRNNISSEIDEFNSSIKNIAKHYTVKFIDITDISRSYPNDYDLIADDKLHPSSKMYTKWVDAIYPEVLKMLEEVK